MKTILDRVITEITAEEVMAKIEVGMEAMGMGVKEAMVIEVEEEDMAIEVDLVIEVDTVIEVDMAVKEADMEATEVAEVDLVAEEETEILEETENLEGIEVALEETEALVLQHP